jgi:secreted trypsin-like serine protease
VEVKAGPRAVARKLRDRIIGGKPGSYSWAGSLQAGGHYCTGELVAQSWVLTAAHCCGSDTVGDRVVAGRVDLRDQAVGQVTAVAAVYKHEDYATWQKGPDLCLLRLRDPVVGLQPVELADFVVPWGDGVVSGWGRTCETCPTSPVLLEAAVQVLSPDDCRRYYSIVNDTMLCAQAPGRDAAPGDSGGMLLQTAPNGQLVQVGVVSYGRSCSTTDSRCVGAYAELPSQKAGILACIGGGL